MLLIWSILLWQDLKIQAPSDWESLARPWMSEAEERLYDQLAPSDQMLFRGFFVARRLQNPALWPETGLYAPGFHCDKKYGDIRDQIMFAIGEPLSVVVRGSVSSTPAKWVYSAFSLEFITLDGSHVGLAKTSQSTWEKIKQDQIQHPELRYDFREKSFGRTRLPEETHFSQVAVQSCFQVPHQNGAMIRVVLPIPDSLKTFIQKSNVNPTQHMELLVQLKRADQVTDEGPGEFRHAGQSFNLLTAQELWFDVFVPAGFHQMELKAYSGYLSEGLQSSLTVAVKPAEVPTIGDPILSQVWRPAGIETPDSGNLVIGDTVYTPLSKPDRGASRAVVYSIHADTRLLLQTSESSTWLSPVAHEGDWWIFEVPVRSGPFRLLSLGFPEKGTSVALGQHGSLTIPSDAAPPAFAQEGVPNYLALESLSFTTPGDLSLLFVNDHPYLGSRNGQFDWRSLDWGKVAQLRFEYAREGIWTQRTASLRRSGVFEQMEVKPQYLVAATSRLDGVVEAAPLQVTVVGQPVKIVQATPFQKLPKLWGLVVNDPLLKSQAWPTIRANLKAWLGEHTNEADLIYVIHSSDRPRMILEPTAYKPLVAAALESLTPQAPNNSYFTVQYLLDALTHLSLHQTRAHQVLILTNGLTDEIKQMEDLIPKLRRTGLQLYNLEFPFETPSQDLQGSKGEKVLEEMAMTEELRRRDRMNMRDHFLEDRDGVQVGSYSFGKKKPLTDQMIAARTREEAFAKAFNRQVATLTAGLAQSAGMGQTVAEQIRFFENLTAWQASLIHLELSVPYLDEDLVKVLAPEGFSASWTLVSWRPQPGQMK